MAAASCDICDSVSSKYRCPKCRTRSCSLQCFKTHQNQCQTAIAEEKDVTASASQAGVSTSSPVPNHARGPHMVTGKSARREDVQKMFDTHPGLKSKLKAIYDATLDPRSVPAREDGLAQFDKSWSEAKGFVRGMDLLQRELNSDPADVEDVRAFAAYIAASSGSRD